MGSLERDPNDPNKGIVPSRPSRKTSPFLKCFERDSKTISGVAMIEDTCEDLNVLRSFFCTRLICYLGFPLLMPSSRK
jgi:hypothetical protein